MQRIRFVMTWAVLWVMVLTVHAAPHNQVDNLITFSSDLRADLESIADTVFGAGNRPDSWTANIDRTTATYSSDLWFDGELVANALFSEASRPAGWIGITAPKQEIIVRNVRHDLEISADDVYGETRPAFWKGTTQLLRCDRTTMNLITLLQNEYAFEVVDAFTVVDFCGDLVDDARVALLNDYQLEIQGDVLSESILAVRGDLERLANEIFGVNDRPIAWTGNADITSPLLLTDTYDDLELLADLQLGEDNRPQTWIGAVTSSSVETYRNIRYDLELLADRVVPTLPTITEDRPRGWQGATDPLRRCDFVVQDFVIILESIYNTDEETRFNRDQYLSSTNFCEDILLAANNHTENPPLTERQQEIATQADSVFFGESEIAFAYLDMSALQYMGMMPRGTEFRAWYRNFNDSHMMFVAGDGFAVYLDRRWTTLPQDVFDRLPVPEGVLPLTFCEADWCQGPGPTPTPTGSALDALLAVATPEFPPTSVPSQTIPLEEKTQLTFEYVRVTYLSDNLESRVAQVSLELCQETTLTTCEVVTRIFDTVTATDIPSVSQFGGRAVFELDYGYTAGLIIESASLVSSEVFISDPSLRAGS
ncbi:MAG: hypothetical protein ACOYLB_09045 [Phototrophicaceae bacterium]